jgi:putative transposase
MELKRNSNAVYLLNYHLILITKYRKKVFNNDIIVERTKEIMRDIANDFKCDIINQECGEDHIHLMISTKPTTDLTKLVNLLKATSSRYIRKEFENELSDILYGDSFWSDSYYIATAGNVSVDTIYKYIDNQRKKI